MLVPMKGADLAPLRTAAAAYLEPRRLLESQVHVIGARSVPIRVQLTIRLMPDALIQSTRDAAVAALTKFFDPIGGGEDGQELAARPQCARVGSLSAARRGCPVWTTSCARPAPPSLRSSTSFVTDRRLATRQVRNACERAHQHCWIPTSWWLYDATTAAIDLDVKLPPVSLGT